MDTPATTITGEKRFGALNMGNERNAQ